MIVSFGWSISSSASQLYYSTIYSIYASLDGVVPSVVGWCKKERKDKADPSYYKGVYTKGGISIRILKIKDYKDTLRVLYKSI